MSSHFGGFRKEAVKAQMAPANPQKPKAKPVNTW